MSKPKLNELLKNVGPAPEKKPPTRKMLRRHAKDQSDSLDIEMIRKWAPHLVACDFDRHRSLELAFPTLGAEHNRRKLAYRLITHPMFTDVMAAHLDTVDNKLGNSERYVLDRMYRQAEANVADYFDSDENGNLKAKNIKDLPRYIQQNIKKLKITNKVVETGISRQVIEQTIDIEIVDAFKPIQALGKNLGMIVERVEMDFGKQTADRLQAALERVKQKRIGQSNAGTTPQ